MLQVRSLEIAIFEKGEDIQIGMTHTWDLLVLIQLDGLKNS